ncbi:MAG TPA: hypothetical protein VH351_04260 [Bryobacteraceae bacterium]|nr:hypothetical protein [Bryobacteraceae bacterium]
MKYSRLCFASAALPLLLGTLTVSCRHKSGRAQDEAMLADRAAASLPAADEDYFHDMDGGMTLTVDEIKGRNTWNVWSGGNDKFWDVISKTSYGNLDLLKTLSSYPKLKFSRDNRWNYLGLVNEPCFDKPAAPDPNRFGLWLDKRRSDCPADPFENETKYPGIKIGARGKNMPVGSLYGYATGVLGLRLFPNPDFDQDAAKKWDPKRYYEDPAYYLSKDLIKPYRVGMSCGFCHISAHPLKPPADPENPKFENLSSTVGAQYFWIDRIFAWDADASSFTFQLFHTSRPGSLDTSLVASDNINNPRTMNAVYSLGPRLQEAKRWGKETLAGGGLNNKQFNDYVQSGLLTTFFQAPNTVYTPRVLKDGSDSVGALGALNRVFLNIGLFSEEWMMHFNPLLGGKPQTPIEIAVAEKNSSYWQATEMQSPAMAQFFLKTTDPHHLKDAPGGDKYLSKDQAQLNRGKIVFADYCARCHSSKAPAPAQGLDPGGCAGPQYLACWNRYFAWTMTEDFKTKMRSIVQAADFLQDNYLSTDLRVPVTLLETNACSPLSSNSIAGNIWDNFSSQSYKDLPSVGTITVQNPFTGERKQFQAPGGGRGYTRPPSLISVWSTAPFLVNNTLGKFNPSPSVDARIQSFQDSIEKLLWPEKREKDSMLPDKLDGVVDRTTQTSYLRVPKGYLPDFLQPLVEPGDKLFPWLLADSGIQIGPIPAGTPVNILANVDALPQTSDPAQRLQRDKKLLDLILRIKHDLKSLPPNATDEQARQVFANLADPLLELSKCPDFVVNRGHYFGTNLDKTGEAPLSDTDKRALIEFLKTF